VVPIQMTGRVAFEGSVRVVATLCLHADFGDLRKNTVATGAAEMATLSGLTGPLYGGLSDKADPAASLLVKIAGTTCFRGLAGVWAGRPHYATTKPI